MGELANAVRAKYAGQYDHVDDATLESAIVKKYPGSYDHLVPQKQEKNASPQPEVGFLDRVGNSLSTGATKYIGMPVAGIEQMVGKATGSKYLEDRGNALYSRYKKTLEENEAVDPTQEFGGEHGIHDVGSALKWGTQQVSEMVPQIALGIATGGIGGFVGKKLVTGALTKAATTGAADTLATTLAGKAAAKITAADIAEYMAANGVTKEIAQSALLKNAAINRGVNWGTAIAGGSTSIPLEATSIYQAMPEDKKEVGRAALFGTLAALPDMGIAGAFMHHTGLGGKVNKLLHGIEQPVKETARETLGQAGLGVLKATSLLTAEGAGQEALQTVIERIGAREELQSEESKKNGFFNTIKAKGLEAAIHPEAWKDIRESAAAGGLLGGLGGATTIGTKAHTALTQALGDRKIQQAEDSLDLLNKQTSSQPLQGTNATPPISNYTPKDISAPVGNGNILVVEAVDEIKARNEKEATEKRLASYDGTLEQAELAITSPSQTPAEVSTQLEQIANDKQAPFEQQKKANQLLSKANTTIEREAEKADKNSSKEFGEFAQHAVQEQKRSDKEIAPEIIAALVEKRNTGTPKEKEHANKALAAIEQDIQKKQEKEKKESTKLTQSIASETNKYKKLEADKVKIASDKQILEAKKKELLLSRTGTREAKVDASQKAKIDLKIAPVEAKIAAKEAELKNHDSLIEESVARTNEVQEKVKTTLLNNVAKIINNNAGSINNEPITMQHVHNLAVDLYGKVKTASEFTKELVKNFGKQIAIYAKQLWEYVKSIQPGLSIKETTNNEIFGDKLVDGDIWDQPGLKVVGVNLGGIHGAGLAKQAHKKGLLEYRKDRSIDEYRGGEVIPLAVKGHAPETAKIKGQAWSETTTGNNVALLESEVKKLIAFAKENPDTRINLPFIGLGFGEGDAQGIIPILHRAAQEPNIFMVSANKATFEKHRDTVTGKTRTDHRAERLLSGKDNSVTSPQASQATKTEWYKKYAGKELTKKEVDVLVAEMIRYGATDNKAERNNQIVKSEFNSNDEISKTAKLINAFDKWYEEKPSSEYRLADASVDSATNKLVFTRWISAIVTEIVDPNESLTATAISTKWRPIDWLANPGNMSYFGEHQVVPRLNALLPGFSEWVKGFKPLDNSWVDGLLDTVGKDEEYNKAQKDKQSATLAVITALETVRRRIPELSESDMPILMTDALYNILAKKLGISQENKEPEQPQKEKTQEREYTPDNITSLAPNEVFVFGANTVGGHGGGAAGLAQFGDTKSNYDAPPIGTKGKWSEYGVVDRLMEGTEGKSFGLVTKSAAIVKGKLYIHGKRSVDFARISKSLDALVKVANEHPELKFLVTEFGTRMAGFTAEEMKSILASKVLPDNVILPKSFETRPDVIVVEDAKEAVKESVVKDEKDYSAPIASEFVNHSGGAKGSDAFWDRTGKVFGVTDHRHYREESAEKLGDKFLNDEGVEPVRIKEDSTEWEVATRKAMLATLALRPTTRIDDKTKRMVIIEGESAFAPEDLQIRNWFQVKNAEAVFAIGRIVEPADMSSFAAYSKAGDKQRSTKANKKGERYINNSGKQIVDGGTGYAVEMAIQKGDIPVYVFDQTRGSWFKWDALKNEFTKTDTPTLTKNFAGIGTRELTPEGMKAIRDVYAKTFSTENNRRADRLIEDVSTEMANSEERIKEIERKKEEAKKEAEGLAPLEAFFVYVGKGVYQEWFNNRVAWIGMIEAEKERQSILQQHVDSIKKDFPRYKIVGLKQDGLDTVEIEQDSPLYEYPGFERLMVGAHGVYAEFGEASRPFIAKESITNPVKQSDSRQYITYYSNGSRVYDQRKMVNYAQYEIGKLYVSADVVEGLSTRNEVAAPIIAKAHAERSGINSWNEQGVTSISRETIQQLNDVYELFSDLSKKEMIDWLKNQLENRLDIELNGVAEKVLMTDENGNSLVVSKTIKPARTTSPTGSMGLRRFDSESEEQHRTVVAYNSATALGKPTNNFVFSTKNGSSTVAMVAPGDGELEIWSYVEGFFEDTYTTKIASKSPSAARELKATATSVDKDPYKYIGSTDSIAAFAYKASYPNGVGLSKEERDAHRFETTRKIQEGLERKNEELLKSIEKDINSNPVLNGSSPESIITYTSPSDPDERRAYFTNNKVSTIVVGLLRDVMNRGYDLKSFYKSMFYEEASKSFASTKEIPVMLVAFHSYINRDRASNAEYDGPYNEQNDAHKTISQEAEHLVSVAPAEEHTKRQGLNKEQQEAVDYSGGPQLIVAGAGTGKTTVITERIKSLVNKGIPPEEILAITFARDARKEMKDRLEGTNAESANVSTFHAFGKGILDEYYKEFGYRSKPAVLSELQSTQIVESIMKELGIADMTPDEALAAIDKLKNDGVTPGKYAKQKDKSASISNIYTEYAEKTKNSIDLNDMILGMKQHLLNNPAILNDVQNSIRSMLVDEYQDTNKAQYELMSLLAPHDLTVVGDDNQSLYSWRGADVGALKNFMSDFNPKVTQLVENYRTTGTILEAAQDVISKNEDRISTNLTPSREEGNPIIYREVANEKDEAFFIAKEIKDAISRGAAPGSIAILTRTNAQHAIINRELASRKIFGIHVQTFNGAKGREFSTVFIAGVSEGLTPHVKAGDTLEEERRLLYVGMTRAKDNLIMTHANETSQGGKTAEKEPSRFLADIKPGRWDEKSTQMVDVKKEKFSDLTAEEWEYGYAEDIKAADRHEAFQGASRKMTDADRVDTFESEFGVQRAQHEFDSGHDGNLVRDQYKRDNKEVAGFYEYYDGAKEKRKQKEAAFNVRQLQSLQEMVAFNRTSAEFIAPLFDALDVLIDQVPTNKKHTDLSPAEKKERKKLTSSRLKDALKIVVDKSEDLVALKEAYSAAIESGKIDAIVANFMRALTHFNGKQVLAHQGILNQNYQGLENESIPFMQFGTAEFSEALKELTPLGEQISANPVLYTGLDLDETYRDTVQLVNIQKAAADPLEIAQGFAPDLDSELQAWKRPASMQDIHNSVVESVGNNVSPSLRQAIRVYRTRSAAIAIYDERLANVDGLMKLLSFLSSAEIDKAKYENKIANPEFKTYATEEQRTAWMASMKEGLAYINDTIDKIKAKIPKGTSLESLRKTKDRIQRDTVAMQSLARPVLMRIAFEQSHVMDASLFTKIAGDFNKVHPDSKLTAADVFNKYLAVGADIVRLHSEMNRLSRDFWDKQIAKAYGIGKVSRQVKAREVLLARLTTEEKDLLAQMGSHKGDAVDVLKNLSAPVRNKMIAIFNAEIALKNIDVKASMRELDKDKKASMENVKKQEAEPSIQQKIDALNNQIIELKKQEQGLWDIVSRRAYVGKGINRYKAEWKTNSAYIMMSRLFSPSELSVFYPGVEPQDYLDNSANRISRSVDSPILEESNIRGKKPLQKVTNIEIHNPSSQKTILAKHLTIRPSLQQQQEIQQAEQRLLELRKMQSALEQDITNLENADIADVLGSVTTPQQIRSLEDVAQEKAPEHYTQEEADVVSRYKGANLKAVSLKGVAKFFFEKIANIFGANLVTVKGDSDWHGKYIPNRGKGKPTIVINVNAPSLTAVFAHEMFHHILNKISHAAYDAFREAMRGAVNENKWEEAVIRIARQMDSSYVKTVLDDVILTDSINTSPLYGSNFNDDPLVRKKKASFWKPKEPPIAKDKKFAAFQRHDKLNVSDEIREEIENELYSEIFSQAIHKGAFWSTLGKTLEGRGVVAYCVSHMANRSASILSLLKQISPETQNSYLVSQLVKNWSDPASFNTDAKEGRSIHDILVGVIDNSLFVDKKGNVTAKTIVNGMELGLRDDVTRDRKINLLNEAKLLSGEIKKKTNVLAKEARKIIPQGTNGYVQVMDAIENWINRILDWLAAHKPAGMFADFRTREEIVALAQKVLHG
ncbi:UvrD-like DNA helicase, C-terminal, partial [uncultured Caudovirales phage]